MGASINGNTQNRKPIYNVRFPESHTQILIACAVMAFTMTTSNATAGVVFENKPQLKSYAKEIETETKKQKPFLKTGNITKSSEPPNGVSKLASPPNLAGLEGPSLQTIIL